MLATLAEAPLTQKGLVYEPKYDGIRALVEMVPAAKGVTARIWSRSGNEKTAQFPAIVRALEAAGRKLRAPMVLDGEIVALDERGRPAGFQRLQGRMHLVGARDVERAEQAQPATFIAFDILRDGREDLTRLPLIERRKRLEQVFNLTFRLKAEGHVIRLSEQVRDDASAMHARAVKERWEGLIAKDASSTYQPGRRSPAWRKVKLVQGFDQKELARVSKLLKARETARSPFSEKIKANEPAHWVRPDLVAQIRFTEWTTDDKLRHPVYLGLRDDKSAGEVVREAVTSTKIASGATGAAAKFPAATSVGAQGAAALTAIIDQLRALEDARRDGELALPNGDRLKVTNLAKPFWPDREMTKGSLLRYYVEVSPYLLPAVGDRPLVMKRFPNGVGGKAFYQQRSREERPPAGVRIETLEDRLDPIGEPDAKRLIGGSLTTLLYMTQIAAISQDPRPGFPEDVRRQRAPHLHPATAEHLLRVRSALLPDCCDRRRHAPSQRGDRRAGRGAAAARHRLR